MTASGIWRQAWGIELMAEAPSKFCRKVQAGDVLTFELYGKQVHIEIGERAGKSTRLTAITPRDVDIKVERPSPQT